MVIYDTERLRICSLAQVPLQPLQDNLESATYETFEKDPVKYAQYEKALTHLPHSLTCPYLLLIVRTLQAIAQALEERFTAEEQSGLGLSWKGASLQSTAEHCRAIP